MNYAWANPSTGLREQTDEAETPKQMSSRLAEAKRYVWTELQALMPTDDQCKIYVQHPIGIVTVDGFQIDPDQAKITHAYSETHGDSLFAWCDPETGEREIAANMLTCPGSLKWSDPTIFLVSALKRLQEARQPTDSVIVYATWEECEVKRSDPEPELPPELSLPQPEEARTSCAADIERRNGNSLRSQFWMTKPKSRCTQPGRYWTSPKASETWPVRYARPKIWKRYDPLRAPGVRAPADRKSPASGPAKSQSPAGIYAPGSDRERRTGAQPH